jgi:hypothetical protein
MAFVVGKHAVLLIVEECNRAEVQAAPEHEGSMHTGDPDELARPLHTTRISAAVNSDRPGSSVRDMMISC